MIILNTNTLRQRLLAGTALVAIGSFTGTPVLALDPNTLPTGGRITAGSGSISQTGARMDVNQTSQRMIANWNGFSIGANASVTFNQPNSGAVALNRVTGNDPSQIYGRLAANGQVFLINPNGVLFGPSARVDVGGIVASTLNITDKNFMTGRYTFTNEGGAGSVVNQGTISVVDRGYAALFGTTVSNQGVITARQGSVALGAGDTVSIDFGGDGLINLAVDKGTLNALVENKGAIRADGGTVVMRARNAGDLAATVVNQSGVIEARAITDVGGKIVLDGGEAGIVAVSGTLDASGKGAGQRGGSVTVQGDKVGLFAGAKIDASGASGGGTVKVGGGRQGKDATVRNASATYMDAAVAIDASALGNGDGGTVILWSNDYTGFYGTIRAMGGSLGGNGGFVETSSHNNLQAFGKVDAAAAAGKPGTWLLDPENVTISSTTSNGSLSANVFTPSGDDATVASGDISAALNSGNTVQIVTGGSSTGSQNGDITIASNISHTAGGAASLFLGADGNIIVNSNITLSGSSGNALNVYFSTGDGGGLGAITLNSGSSISTFGGFVKFGGGYASVADWTTDPTSTSTTHYAVGSSPATPNGITLTGASINTTLLNNTTTVGAGNILIAGLGYLPALGDSSASGNGVVITGDTSLIGNNISIFGAGGTSSYRGQNVGGGGGVLIGPTSQDSINYIVNNFGFGNETIPTTTTQNRVSLSGNGNIIIQGTGGNGNSAQSYGQYPGAGGVGLSISGAEISTSGNNAYVSLGGVGGQGGDGFQGRRTFSATYGGTGGDGALLFDVVLDAPALTGGAPSVDIEGKGGAGGAVGTYYSTPNSPEYAKAGDGGSGVFTYNVSTQTGTENILIRTSYGMAGAESLYDPNNASRGTIGTLFYTAGALNAGSGLLIIDASNNTNPTFSSNGITQVSQPAQSSPYSPDVVTAGKLQINSEASQSGAYGSSVYFDVGINNIASLSAGNSTNPITFLFLNNGANSLSIDSFPAQGQSLFGAINGSSGITGAGAVVRITTTGTVTQTSPIIINQLDLFGTGSTYLLDHQNSFSYLNVGGETSKVSSATVNNTLTDIYGIFVYADGTTKLSTTGSATNGGGVIVSSSLLLGGVGGSWSLTGTDGYGGGNYVGTIAGNTGSVLFLDSQNLSVGTVGGVTGLTASANVMDAIVLSTPGLFTNSVGANGLTVTGTSNNPRWVVYSDNTATIVKGGLVGSEWLTLGSISGTLINTDQGIGTNVTVATATDLASSGNTFVFLQGTPSGSSSGGSSSGSGSGSSGSSTSSGSGSSGSSTSSGSGSSGSSTSSGSGSSGSSTSSGSGSSSGSSSSGSTSTTTTTTTSDNAAATAVRAASNPQPSSNGTSTTSSTASSAPPPVSTQTTTVNQSVPAPGGGATLSGGLINLSADLVSSSSPATAPASSPSTTQPSTQGSPNTTTAPTAQPANTVSTAASGGSTTTSSPSFGTISANLPDARILNISSGTGGAAATIVVRQSGDTLILSATPDTGGGVTVAPSFQQPSATSGGGTGLGVFTVSGDQTAQVGSFQVGYSAGNLTMAPGSSPVATMAPPADTGSVVTFRVATQNGGEAEFGLSFTNGALSIRPLNDSANAISSSGSADKKLVSATGLLQAQQKMGIDVGQVRAIFVHAS